MLPESDDFSSLVLDSLRLQETIAAAQQAPAHERAWFLQDTRQTLFIAGLHWMIQHDEACELLEPLPLAFLPGMPTWFRGLAHWHGQALPVLDFWPWRYATNYQFRPGPGCPAPLSRHAPDFHDCYVPVGDFPEVAVGPKWVLVRMLTAFGAGLVPIL